MGFVKKITGAAAKEKALKQQAAFQAQQLAANAKAQADALNMQTQQANDAVMLQAAQGQAAALAAKAASLAAPDVQGMADVQLQAAPAESATESNRKRRAAFGRNAATGVNI